MLDDKRIVGLAVGLVLVVLALAVDAALGLAALWEVLTGPTADPLLVALVEAALPYLLVGALLVGVGLALLAALVVVAARAAGDRVDTGRLREWVERAERRSDALRRLGVSDRL